MSKVEDAIKVRETIVGTITLEQYRKLREDERCGKHIVKRQPGSSSDVGGDAA